MLVQKKVVVWKIDWNIFALFDWITRMLRGTWCRSLFFYCILTFVWETCCIGFYPAVKTSLKCNKIHRISNNSQRPDATNISFSFWCFFSRRRRHISCIKKILYFFLQSFLWFFFNNIVVAKEIVSRKYVMENELCQ